MSDYTFRWAIGYQTPTYASSVRICFTYVTGWRVALPPATAT